MQQACPSGLCSASQENQSRGSAKVGQAQPGRLKAGSSARDAPSETGRDHRDHHAGNRLAAPLGPRLFDGGGAHQARPDARLREDRRSARLPHRRKRCLAEAQSQAGPQGGVTGMPRPSFDRAAIETEIVRVRSLGLDALRTLWRVTFRSSPPPAFTKDLMARFLCWHVQEQARGGLDPETAKHLDGLARGGKPGADRPRRLKPGTVLLREYQGERHIVTVVPNGYLWRETAYASLSTIARAITGTAWSGPRFFGLRSGADRSKDIEHELAGSQARTPDADRLHRH